MTARLAPHPDVADLTPEVLQRLVAAGVDVELLASEPLPMDAGPRSGALSDPLRGVRESTADLAVVGLRALRGSAAEDLTTVAVLPRLEVRDVLVTVTGSATLRGLPRGARVGLSGARRRAFLAAHRPDVVSVPLDGPGLDRVATRYRARLEGRDDAGETSPSSDRVDAILVSALEARAAGLTDAMVEALEPKAWLPEPGQGALALVARHPIAEASALDHLPTRTALRAELALLDALEADENAAIGCLAQPSGRWIRLWAAAVSADGRRLVRSDRTGPLDEPEGLGAAVAKELVVRGIELLTSAST